jgi:hypothetical protein
MKGTHAMTFSATEAPAIREGDYVKIGNGKAEYLVYKLLPAGEVGLTAFAQLQRLSDHKLRTMTGEEVDRLVFSRRPAEQVEPEAPGIVKLVTWVGRQIGELTVVRERVTRQIGENLELQDHLLTTLVEAQAYARVAYLVQSYLENGDLAELRRMVKRTVLDFAGRGSGIYAIREMSTHEAWLEVAKLSEAF